MPTSYTQLTRPSTAYTPRARLTKWKSYLLDESSNYIYDNEWNRVIIYTDDWYEEVPSIVRTPRTSI